MAAEVALAGEVTGLTLMVSVAVTPLAGILTVAVSVTPPAGIDFVTWTGAVVEMVFVPAGVVTLTVAVADAFVVAEAVATGADVLLFTGADVVTTGADEVLFTGAGVVVTGAETLEVVGAGAAVDGAEPPPYELLPPACAAGARIAAEPAMATASRVFFIMFPS